MNTKPPANQWTLTPVAFDRFLAALNPNREQAGAEYEALREMLMRFFQWQGDWQAQEHADETLNRVARRLAEGEVIKGINNYCLGVARRLLLESHRQRTRQESAFNQIKWVQASNSEATQDDLSLTCLEHCLEGLPEESRALILRYYESQEMDASQTRQIIADHLHIPLNALRLRAQRIRNRLEKCVNQCLGESLKK